MASYKEYKCEGCVLVVGTGIWVYPSTCPYGYPLLMAIILLVVGNNDRYLNQGYDNE